MQTPEAQEVQGIADQWYELALKSEIDQDNVFFRFIAVWIAFNALYASRHSREAGDWKQVRSFAGEPEAIARHGELLTEDTKYQENIGVLRERGVFNPSRGSRRKIHREHNLTEVVSCLYQVRCNLFHGEKMPEKPRDERLVESSYYIVSQLIKPYMEARWE